MAPNRPLVVVGLGLLIGDPTVLWGTRYLMVQQSGGPRFTPAWALVWLPIGGVLLFAAGWLLIGAALRPRGDARRGMVLAGILYIAIGFAWLVLFNAGLSGRFVLDVLNPTALQIALIWPFQVAQVLGLFGLTMN
jgi:hypothetical protein